MFLLKTYLTQILIGAGVLSVGILLYIWHYKPINDLTNENTQKTVILKAAEKSVVEHNIKSEAFSDKWNTVKKASVNNINVNTKDIKNAEDTTTINTSIGEHSLSL